MSQISLTNLISCDEYGNIPESNKQELKNILKSLKSVNLKIHGFNPESKKITFKFSIDRKTNFKEASENLQVVLDASDYISVNDNPKTKKFKSIIIQDKDSGYNGSYSLIMNDKQEFAIMKEYNKETELITLFSEKKSLSETLEIVSKKISA